MTKNTLRLINLGVIGLIIITLILAIVAKITRPSEIPVIEKVGEPAKLPKGNYTLSQEKYEQIGSPLLSLRYAPMSLQLPDLKRFLVYYGKNERPDASAEQAMMHFGLIGSNDIASVPGGKPLYLIYDKNKPQVKYKFSPQNHGTSLWVEAFPLEKEVKVQVSMKNEAGEIIREPSENAEFLLKERPQTRITGDDWKIGKLTVDGSLLARQKARWYGPDVFLQKHGGEEYKESLNKQRIDFGEGKELYSVYVGPEDVLAWIDGKWKEIKPGKDSQKYSILVVKNVEDRILRLDLWDVDGKRKIQLNLIKSSESWLPQSLQKEFKFVGSRTRSQFVFELNKERMTLSPRDWLLKTKQGWVKLATAQDIDSFVERKATGPLFVFDGLSKKEGKQMILGTLFNSTRTEMQPIEILVQQGATATVPKVEEKKEPIRKIDELEEENEDSFSSDEDEEESEMENRPALYEGFRARGGLNKDE